MKKIIIIATLIILNSFAFAEKVDTISVFSNSMKKNIKSCVITPSNYLPSGNPYPVLYLLSGYNSNYADWFKYFPEIRQFSDLYNMIIVCANSGYSSWYFDSPVDSTMKYETYITKELINFIDSSYNTFKSRNGRAISGLSMGGHGALYLSIKHQDIFGAAGSMSGGLDIRPFHLNWDLSKRLGEQNKFPENWEKNTVINLLHLVSNNNLAIMVDCGVDDFLISTNRAFHEKMLYLNIKHDYIERPGGHTLEYFHNALQYQLLFFYIFFKSNKSK
jgi:Predicted esterase